MADGALYDRIGTGYATARTEDPRIARRIRAALGDARSVLNVGAGTGSYEPDDREVVAVEPSAVMIGQRARNAAGVVQAEAEDLPFADDSFDAAMAILSDHHWRDRARGLRELRRVARKRVVLFNADPEKAELFWLTSEYLRAFLGLIPDAHRQPGAWKREFKSTFGHVRLQPVPVPHDCTDGFYSAFWRRPQAYLDPRVRDGTSVFGRLPQSDVQSGLQRLAADLDSGAWFSRHAGLLGLQELDVGLTLVIITLN